MLIADICSVLAYTYPTDVQIRSMSGGCVTDQEAYHTSQLEGSRPGSKTHLSKVYGRQATGRMGKKQSSVVRMRNTISYHRQRARDLQVLPGMERVPEEWFYPLLTAAFLN